MYCGKIQNVCTLNAIQKSGKLAVNPQIITKNPIILNRVKNSYERVITNLYQAQPAVRYRAQGPDHHEGYVLT